MKPEWDIKYCYMVFLQWRGAFKMVKGKLYIYYPLSHHVRWFGTTEEAALLMKYLCVGKK